MSDRVFLDANPSACCVFELAIRLTGHYRGRCRTPCGVSFINTRPHAPFDALGAAIDDVMAIIPGPFAVQEPAALTGMLFFVLAMLAALVLIPAGCVIYNAFRNSGLV